MKFHFYMGIILFSKETVVRSWLHETIKPWFKTIEEGTKFIN